MKKQVAVLLSGLVLALVVLFAVSHEERHYVDIGVQSVTRADFEVTVRFSIHNTQDKTIAVQRHGGSNYHVEALADDSGVRVNKRGFDASRTTFDWTVVKPGKEISSLAILKPDLCSRALRFKIAYQVYEPQAWRRKVPGWLRAFAPKAERKTRTFMTDAVVIPPASIQAKNG